MWHFVKRVCPYLMSHYGCRCHISTLIKTPTNFCWNSYLFKENKCFSRSKIDKGWAIQRKSTQNPNINLWTIFWGFVMISCIQMKNSGAFGSKIAYFYLNVMYFSPEPSVPPHIRVHKMCFTYFFTNHAWVEVTYTGCPPNLFHLLFIEFLNFLGV